MIVQSNADWHACMQCFATGATAIALGGAGWFFAVFSVWQLGPAWVDLGAFGLQLLYTGAEITTFLYYYLQLPSDSYWNDYKVASGWGLSVACAGLSLMSCLMILFLRRRRRNVTPVEIIA